jgi:hypothetical protein
MRREDRLNSMLAGLAAGSAYLAAQMLFARAAGGLGSEPLQRIAAILLGPAVLPPPAQWSATIVGMALLVHLPLSAVYGRLIGALVNQLDGVAVPALAGAVVGAVIYVVHRWFIAPMLFPWFEASRSAVTALDHVLFGVVAATCCVALRRHRQGA